MNSRRVCVSSFFALSLQHRTEISEISCNQWCTETKLVGGNNILWNCADTEQFALSVHFPIFGRTHPNKQRMTCGLMVQKDGSFSAASLDCIQFKCKLVQKYIWLTICKACLFSWDKGYLPSLLSSLKKLGIEIVKMINPCLFN